MSSRGPSAACTELASLYREGSKILPVYTTTVDNALHIAAADDLSFLAREIAESSPELALSFNERGLAPFHVAIANGSASVVKALVESKVGFDICNFRDKGGFLPVQIAVMKGSFDIFKHVCDNCSLSKLLESTCCGDSILHLAVKFDAFKIFLYLWQLLGADNALINRKDAEGNTVLHLAVAKKEQEIVKRILLYPTSKVAWLDVNALNKNGSTALDVFFSSEMVQEDMKLGETIRRVGGRRAVDPDFLQPQKRELEQLEQGEHEGEEGSNPHSTCSLTQYSRPKSIKTSRIADMCYRYRQFNFKIRTLLSQRVYNDKDKETSNTLMVVATLIATITFQGALNPPGGFFQDGDKQGTAVKEAQLRSFLFFDMMALICSLSVIMLTIYIVPRWKDLLKLAMFIVWMSVMFTISSFLSAVRVVFPSLATKKWIFTVITYILSLIVQIFIICLMFRTLIVLGKLCREVIRAISKKERLSSFRKRVMLSLPVLVAVVLWVPWFFLVHFF